MISYYIQKFSRPRRGRMYYIDISNNPYVEEVYSAKSVRQIHNFLTQHGEEDFITGNPSGGTRYLVRDEQQVLLLVMTLPDVIKEGKRPKPWRKGQKTYVKDDKGDWRELFEGEELPSKPEDIIMLT